MSSSISLSDQVRISAITVVLGITSLSILNALSYVIRRRGVSFLTRQPLPQQTNQQQNNQQTNISQPNLEVIKVCLYIILFLSCLFSIEFFF